MATRILSTLFMALAILVTLFAAAILPRTVGVLFVSLQLALAACWGHRTWRESR